MVNRYFISLVLIYIAVLVGCGDSTSTSSNETIQQVFPLKVGNQWIYSYQEFQNDGGLRIDDTSRFFITDESSFLGHTAFTILVNGDTSKQVMFYYVGQSDLYSVELGQYIFIQLRYPINIGKSVALLDTIYPNGDTRKEFIVLRSKNESIIVPAGAFTCLHFDDIKIGGPPDQIDTLTMAREYYALDKGLVKEDDYINGINSNLYLRQSRKLLSYQVN